MTADISNVINVSLLSGGRLLAATNMNVAGIITGQLGPLSTDEPFRLYRSASAVQNDFGSASEVTRFANAFFGVQPNPVNASGYLVVGYWRASDENTVATSGKLEGAELNEAALIPQLQQITDGAFDIDVDGATQNLTALNFQSVLTLTDVVTIIDTALTGATASLDGIGIVIKSETTGASSTVDFAVSPAAGTDLSVLLGLASGTGAVSTDGLDAGVITAEEPVDALQRLRNLTGIRGACFIGQLTSAEIKANSAWAQANNVLYYEVFTGDDKLLIDPSNVCWEIKLSSYTNTRMIHRLDGNRAAAAVYMARAHTVLFNAENSALTMNLKETSGLVAEGYSQSQITAAKNVGLDIYVFFRGGVPAWLTSGANDYTDNRYNLIAFIDSQQVAGFNHLKGTGTKIPQTTPGVNSLVDALEKDCDRFVRAAVFAPGTWSSPDRFGDFDTFNRAIEQKGYYYLAGKLSDQPQNERQERKSPVIQSAVKAAGAIHSADIIINFNE